MILTIDIGNSNICFGVYEGKTALFTARAKTDPLRTETEYAVLLSQIFSLHGFDPSRLTGAAISSVVPALTTVFNDAVRILGNGNIPTVVVGPGVKTGLNIRIDEPASLGADLACTAVGAAEKYPLPAIIIDLGTATKLTVVTEDRSFIGGTILPGVKISLEALSGSASLLPSIGLGAGKIKTIGTNTWIVCSPVLYWEPPVWSMASSNATVKSLVRFLPWSPAAGFPRRSCRIAAPILF